MHNIAPILIISFGAVSALVGLLMLSGAKARMDSKDKKANIYGSVFLFIIAAMFITGGSLELLSAKKAGKEMENIVPQDQIAAKQEPASPVRPMEKPQQNQEKSQAEQNIKKAEAEKAYESFSQAQKAFNSVLTSYQSDMKDISNGKVGLTDYNNLGKLSQQSLDLFKNVQNMDIAKQYVYQKQLMVTAVLYLQASIDDLIIYTDNKKINKFTEAQDYMQKAIETNKLVTVGVAKQALIDGYTPTQGRE